RRRLTSRLFPYTTLFRSVTTQTLSRSSMPGMLRVGCGQFLERLLDQAPQQRAVVDGGGVDVQADVHAAPVGQDGGVEGGAPGRRSEEHTSELQSRSDLVC